MKSKIPIRERVELLNQALTHVDDCRARKEPAGVDISVLLKQGIGDLDFDWRHFIQTDNAHGVGETRRSGWSLGV